MPRSCSRRSASRTGVRLTPSERAISSSAMRSPGAKRPSQIASRRLANTNSLRDAVRSASAVAAFHLRALSGTTLPVSCDAIGGESWFRSCFTAVYRCIQSQNSMMGSDMSRAGAEAVKSRMQYRGLRGWLEQVDKLGELRKVDGAHWDAEMGGITQMLTETSRGTAPAILFDNVPGYPKGYRTLYGQLSSARRIALTLGLPLDFERKVDVVQKYHQRMQDLKPLPARFIGTADCVMTQDPDTGWFNLGAYRSQVYDGKTVGCQITEGKHGRIHR